MLAKSSGTGVGLADQSLAAALAMPALARPGRANNPSLGFLWSSTFAGYSKQQLTWTWTTLSAPTSTATFSTSTLPTLTLLTVTPNWAASRGMSAVSTIEACSMFGLELAVSSLYGVDRVHSTMCNTCARGSDSLHPWTYLPGSQLPAPSSQITNPSP